MARKLRTRGNHEVVLNRSAGGDAGITFVLTLFGIVMFLPMYYTIIQSLKPLNELFYFPPRFYVVAPTLNNFADLFNLMSDSWVPFSRYIFNTVLISVGGTFGNLVLSSLCAYALAKIDFPGGKQCFWIIQKSLMFSATVSLIISSFSIWNPITPQISETSFRSILTLQLSEMQRPSVLSKTFLTDSQLLTSLKLRKGTSFHLVSTSFHLCLHLWYTGLR